MKEILQHKVVLLVDDDERNTYALSNYLESIDMKILEAKDGKEALHKLQTMTVDIMLLDMMMPVMDGFETLVALKSDPVLSSIPVIAVTAKAMKGDRERCIEAGAWDYIAKPIDLNQLVDKMVRCLK
jgi:CheY-like chemotaxis protein